METKYFRSKYNRSIHGVIWKDTIKDLGVNVYDVIVPCELAVIFGGVFENPSAFTDMLTVVFYRGEPWDDKADLYDRDHDLWLATHNKRNKIWTSILEYYFDEMVDLTGLNAQESADKIRKTVETYQ